MSSSRYGLVETMRTRSRPTGRPCGLRNFAPHICDIPRLEAKMTSGDSSFSRARFKNEKHSMSSIWTSSMKRTCNMRTMTKAIGMISVRRETHSRDDLHFFLLSSLPILCVDLVLKFRLNFPRMACKQRRKPCALLLMTSIS